MELEMVEFTSSKSQLDAQLTFNCELLLSVLMHIYTKVGFLRFWKKIFEQWAYGWTNNGHDKMKVKS